MEFYWSMLNKFLYAYTNWAPQGDAAAADIALLSSITREFPAFLTVTAPHLSERQCWVNNDGKHSQQMPASHWPVSAILASDWLLDMTHTPRTLTSRWAGLGKERGKNWGDFGAKTESVCHAAAPSTRHSRQPGLCFGLEPFGRWERPWTVLDGAITPSSSWSPPSHDGLESSRSSGGWETTSILDNVLCYYWRPIRGLDCLVFVNQKTQSHQTSILMYFATGGDIPQQHTGLFYQPTTSQFCRSLQTKAEANIAYKATLHWRNSGRHGRIFS